MDNGKLICKACGKDSFATGQLGHGKLSTDSNVRPIGSFIASGSPLILSFCKHCGEVASFKVAKPEKF
ncbi:MULTISPECIES: hypothetical protein [Lysinibacillus]|jgi:hypothetical protein|uniref:hypothetical protein n=1 Tax=Lysinibacillus TaxID=400634 RepID=UPI0004D9BFB0|nr:MULTISPECIES: hypothetical protein [Lysinibacillus]AJK87562.1 hypothetical protein HR49_10490 [Lysinibacillus fusiformis]KAB0443956.1 hypothetical protein CH314_10145 [Lysinibacillus fusiformis]KGA80717.1 hypothetical protein KQ41_17950 [Lysinibacillus fusiformis]KHK48645.1 hypothetical protein PI85_22580 [Lysinibacillus sp. A1]MCE4044024.1 hypothetical protein [Lysinibacillus fusiformis]